MEQEYIKGDIVMYNNKIHIITDTLGLNNYRLSHIDHSVPQSELSGVPLTAEILEKNGWKLHKHHERDSYDDVSWSSYHKPAETNISLIFYQEEEAFFPFLYAQEISETPIRYIHQLQHLLFGLGIDNNMEVQVWALQQK